MQFTIDAHFTDTLKGSVKQPELPHTEIPEAYSASLACDVYVACLEHMKSVGTNGCPALGFTRCFEPEHETGHHQSPTENHGSALNTKHGTVCLRAPVAGCEDAGNHGLPSQAWQTRRSTKQLL